MKKINNYTKGGKDIMAVITKSRSYTFENNDEFKKISHESFLSYKKVTKNKQTINEQLKNLENILNEFNNEQSEN